MQKAETELKTKKKDISAIQFLESTNEIIRTKDKKCRGKKYHTHNRNSHANTRFCNVCHATVHTEEDGTCTCCFNKVLREPTFLIVRRIMNQVCARYFEQIEFWKSNPCQDPLICRVNYGGAPYEVDIKYAVLYLETNEMNKEEREKLLKYIQDNIQGVYLEIAWSKKTHAQKIMNEIIF